MGYKFKSSYKTVFISGHRDASQEEFENLYVPAIDKAMAKPCVFVVGDYDGIDTMAQDYLKEKKAKNVIIYHTGSESKYNAGFPTMPGFEDQDACDEAMTDVSDQDIAYVRRGKEESGTAANLYRRLEKNKA